MIGSPERVEIQRSSIPKIRKIHSCVWKLYVKNSQSSQFLPKTGQIFSKYARLWQKMTNHILQLLAKFQQNLMYHSQVIRLNPSESPIYTGKFCLYHHQSQWHIIRTTSTPSDGPPQQSTYIIWNLYSTSTILDDKKKRFILLHKFTKSWKTVFCNIYPNFIKIWWTVLKL